MNSEPVPPGKLFLAIDGRPQGPHTASAVMKMWQEGTIKDDTLICPDGGTAWVTLKEFAPALRPELPPVPPVGYGAAAAATQGAAVRPAISSAARTVVAAKSGDGTKGLRIGSLVAALIFFFLPWVEVRCAGQRVLYQSGIQAVIKKGSVDDMTALLPDATGVQRSNSENPFEDVKLRNETGYAIFAGVGLLALVLALPLAFRSSGRRLSGLLAAAALGCLGLEAVIGFPLERTLKKEMRGGMGPAGMEPPPEFPVGDGIPAGMGLVVVKYSVWFYAELAALGLAAFTGLRRDS